jgi:hypothetical protein
LLSGPDVSFPLMTIKESVPKESHAELYRPTLPHFVLRGICSREPSRAEIYRRVIVASHRYAFSTPPVALDRTFIGAVVELVRVLRVTSLKYAM